MTLCCEQCNTPITLQYYEFSSKLRNSTSSKNHKVCPFDVLFTGTNYQIPSLLFKHVTLPSITLCASHLTRPVVFFHLLFSNQQFFEFLELLWICRSGRRFSPKGSHTPGSREDEEATGATQQNPGSCASESFLNLSHVYFNICARQGLYHLWMSIRFNERFPVATSALSDDDMMSRSEQEIKRTIIIETESQTADRQKRNTLITLYDTLSESFSMTDVSDAIVWIFM